MRAPKKKKEKYKGSPRCSSTDSSYSAEPVESPETKVERNPADLPSEDDAIELQLHDKVLGQHAGELLLDLHWKYQTDEEDKYEGEKKINMLGMIIDGTRVSNKGPHGEFF